MLCVHEVEEFKYTLNKPVDRRFLHPFLYVFSILANANVIRAMYNIVLQFRGKGCVIHI